jgi:hypothetical protein
MADKVPSSRFQPVFNAAFKLNLYPEEEQEERSRTSTCLPATMRLY